MKVTSLLVEVTSLLVEELANCLIQMYNDLPIRFKKEFAVRPIKLIKFPNKKEREEIKESMIIYWAYIDSYKEAICEAKN